MMLLFVANVAVNHIATNAFHIVPVANVEYHCALVVAQAAMVIAEARVARIASVNQNVVGATDEQITRCTAQIVNTILASRINCGR